jgi:hypothetical protein
MALRRALLATLAALLACFGVATAASAKPVFRPRVGPGLGLFPPFNNAVTFSPQLRAAAGAIPVTYHGGQTMTGGITIHAIFWSGGTHQFKPRPSGAPHDYIGMLEQYFTDVAHASTGTSGGPCTKLSCVNFTVEPQFAWGTTPGHITPGNYSVSYTTSSDAFLDTHAYPPKSQQCHSPKHISVCLTDAQIQREVNRVISTTGGARGIHNLWYVFLPGGVDECISPHVCGTNSYSGYHGVSDLGHGPTIYALGIDASIESPATAGSDPEGFPDAERTIDVAAHEVNEAMSDPEGVGYMDPNGFEIGDKCESNYGHALGHAGPDHAPFNQVISGDKYETQEMWVNRNNAGKPHCVQATTNTSSPLPLPQINLIQFSPALTGNIRRNQAGVRVRVALVRPGGKGHQVTVAEASSKTRSDGSWSLSLGKHAVGDDRDVITVDYSGAGAPKPSHETILTGNGGNPFTESGWTGWFDMDHGSRVIKHTLTLAPCFQTGVESYSVGGVQGHESPTDFCNTKTDAAPTPLATAVHPGQAIVWSSNDDRAFTPPGTSPTNVLGALVKLTAKAGEPGSVSQFKLPLHFFTPGGFPTCTAFLAKHRVSCEGLVPGASYHLADGSKHAAAKADGKGVVSVRLAVNGGDNVVLSNGARTLTTLHVAHLRVTVKGKTISGGRCQAGEYFGRPLSKAPTNPNAGTFGGGVALTGVICPLNGNPRGLPAGKSIAQTDEFSGGETVFR